MEPQFRVVALVFASRELTTQSRGVTRRAILAENGKSQTIDFGGTSQLIGRIHVNDKPLSNTRIQLGSGTHGVGIMHQFAMTGDDGRFVFHGAAPGRWILSYQLPPPSFSWIHLQEIDVPASGSSDLSLIEQQTGKVIVNFTDATAEQLDNFYLQLTIYDPAHLSFEQAGHLVQRGSLTDPFVFVQVPLGEYSITGYLKNDQLLRRLAVTEQSRSPSITLKFPVGTASINGVIDQELIEPGKRPFFNLWNVDGSWRSSFQPNDDGTFQIENLAGGKYEIRRGQFQNEDLIDSIALSEGEKKSIHLNPESIKKGADVNRQLTVKVYTTNGAPIPCDVRLEGDKGLSMSRTRYSETTNFAIAPGTYRLTATLPGFKSVTQTVDIASANEKPIEIKVELERSTE